MTRLDEAEIARIVARAHDLGPRERLAYIRAACVNDEEAFDRVLLAHKLTRSNQESDRPENDDTYWEIDRTGQVRWDENFKTLREVGYDGWLVIEAFGRALPDLAAATRVWRDLFPNPAEVYRQGLKLIKDRWAAFAK